MGRRDRFFSCAVGSGSGLWLSPRDVAFAVLGRLASDDEATTFTVAEAIKPPLVELLPFLQSSVDGAVLLLLVWLTLASLVDLVGICVVPSQLLSRRDGFLRLELKSLSLSLPTPCLHRGVPGSTSAEP